VRRSLVERAVTAAIGTAGVDATVESVVARDVTVRPADGHAGRGMTLEDNAAVVPPVPGNAAIRGCLVERAQESGVSFVGATGSVESLHVRDITTRDDGLFGRGISVELDPPSGFRSSVTLERLKVERCHEFGVFVVGSDATIDRAIVTGVSARPVDGLLGAGLAVQLSLETGAPASATIRRATIQDTQQTGLFVAGAITDIESVVIEDTGADGNGLYGDGLLVSHAVFNGAPVATGAQVRQVHIARSARAGFSSFAAPVSLAASTLDCNPIHLAGETYQGLAASFTDGGNNVCGCGDVVEACKVLSADLAPPEPFGQ
jgi:hypothetical protein